VLFLLSERASCKGKASELSVSDNSSPDAISFHNYYRIIGATCRKLANLASLLIDAADPKYVSILGMCTFPVLAEIRMKLPLCAELLAFLERHPTLVCVCVPSRLPCVLKDPTTVHLPLAKEISAPIEVLPLLVGPNVEDLWTLQMRGVYPSTYVLPQLSDKLRSLRSIHTGCSLQLINALSIHAPNLKILSLVSILPRATHSEEVSSRRGFD
jgi:hypothetical protein